MVEFANMFVNFIAGVWTVVFSNTVLDFGTFSVSWGEIIMAGIVLVMVVNLFWKGAKS